MCVCDTQPLPHFLLRYFIILYIAISTLEYYSILFWTVDKY